MKLKIIFWGIAALLPFSCSNDFLHEKLLTADEIASVQSSIIVSPGGEAEDYPVVCPGAGDAGFRIVEKPDWLIVGSLTGKFTGGATSVNCSAKKVNDFSKVGIYCDFMTIEDENGKKYVVQVIYLNEGDPRINLYLYDQPLDFGKTGTSVDLIFSNQGNGILVWEFTGLPEWLACSQTRGAMTHYDQRTVTFTADRNRVPEGKSSVIIYLNSNDASNPKIPITLEIRNAVNNPAGIVDIDGNVTDALLDKSNGKLYYTTAQPNRLVEFDIVSKTVTRSLDLAKAPSCFSISANGQEIAVGQSGQFSIVNRNGFTLTKVQEAYYQINDIAWATDDMVTYTPAGNGQWNRLYWADIHTGATFAGTNVYHQSLIQKIPGYDGMLYTNLQLFPGGITVLNIQTKDTQYYTHESIGNFWFSRDGKYLFCGETQIYRVSDLVSRENISPIAAFQARPVWIDDHTASNSVWSLQGSGNIIQYEANDFTRVKTLNYTDFYIKNGTEYDVEGRYLFANPSGTELVVLRNATNDRVAWSLEFIPVQ
ncbi:MAG: hypothetical protein LBC47_08820 [Tannerella sp.]|jgi:hypothetical protein|nr:hypothetical protein [Tannerella sp.]